MSSELKSLFKPIFRRASSSSFVKAPPAGSDPGDITLIRESTSNKTPTKLTKVRRPPPASTSSEEQAQIIQLPVNPLENKVPPASASQPASPVQEGASALESPAFNSCPKVVIERPTPERGRSLESPEAALLPDPGGQIAVFATPPKRTLRPTIAARRHSPIPDGQSYLFSALQTSQESVHRPTPHRHSSESTARASMPQRKIWVKRAGSSATQVSIGEEDLVDDVRDMIIRKYANSLGRNFDSPDLTLRLVQRKYSARHSNHERLLGPEEVVSKLLDVHYPGGQTIEEALVIDIPQRRTPKHSPRIAMPYYATDILRPGENGSDYFPPMAMTSQHSPQVSTNFSSNNQQAVLHRPAPHSIAVLETGQLPDLPSPGSRMTRHSHRPKNVRTHTTSPTVMSGTANPSNHDGLKTPKPQPLHTPPVANLPPDIVPHHAMTPPARTTSPRPGKNPKRSRKSPQEGAQSPSSKLLDNSVPPINVLIVEDNIINLKLLEAFLKRMKVRWSTAMNGRDAVSRWREGGFHLVLMDIQLPVMNGLDATKEIRRLERVNDIGVFTNTPGSDPTDMNGEDSSSNDAESGGRKAEDNLQNIALFKSSVIIVALTASSLQSDRHEALAAGCNDFLTKPVSFDWLSRKVMEWGCMQALIDFDGWRKWKDMSSDPSSKKVPAPSASNRNGSGTPSTFMNAPNIPSPLNSRTPTNASDATSINTTLPPSMTTSTASTSSSSTTQIPSTNHQTSSSTPLASGTNGSATSSTPKDKPSRILNGLRVDRNSASMSDGTGTETEEGETGTDTNGEDGSGGSSEREKDQRGSGHGRGGMVMVGAA